MNGCVISLVPLIQFPFSGKMVHINDVESLFDSMKFDTFNDRAPGTSSDTTVPKLRLRANSMDGYLSLIPEHATVTANIDAYGFAHDKNNQFHAVRRFFLPEFVLVPQTPSYL